MQYHKTVFLIIYAYLEQYLSLHILRKLRRFFESSRQYISVCALQLQFVATLLFISSNDGLRPAPAVLSPHHCHYQHAIPFLFAVTVTSPIPRFHFPSTHHVTPSQHINPPTYKGRQH